jgi:protein TonB
MPVRAKLTAHRPDGVAPPACPHPPHSTDYSRQPEGTSIFKTAKTLALALVAAACVAGPANAESAEWIKQVTRTIAAKQTYPKNAQARGEEGTAKVKIFVAASGAIERAELIAPSGSTTLDREALSLPSRTGSVPPPPGGATSVTVPITWKLL